MMFIKFLLCCLLMADGCMSAKILGILPTPSISHQLPFRLIMRALHARGHEITIITTDPIKKNLTNYREIDVSHTYEYWRSTFDFTSMYKLTPLALIDVMIPMGAAVAEIQLKSPQVQEFIKSDEKFDVVIIEALMYHSYYGLIHKAGSPPLIGFLSLGMLATTNRAMGNPILPAYCPDMILGYSHHMTFWQRAYNAYAQFKIMQKWDTGVYEIQEALLRKYFGPDPPKVYDTERNMSLVLTNNHWSMNYPRPNLPSVIELTGLHIEEERQPLPKKIKDFIEGAKHGVVYFSLGSNVRGSTMPEDKRIAFLEAFSQLKQRVLWKWEVDDLPGKPDNVMTSKWLPQQDVLAHPNVKLFITQCGLQSMNEAGYYGVPMVAIPFFGDQAHNAAKMVDAGIAKKLEFADVTKESVLSTIKAVLEDKSYREAMDKFSAMYKDEPRQSIKRAVWWVEYVLRHKGAKHLRSAALDLHWTQALLLDVLAVLMAAVAIAAFIFYKILRWVFKKLTSAEPHKRKIH